MISVIVPAYNYGRYLADALESVAAQAISEWECIVLDDGSTDDTAAVAQRFVDRDPRFRYIRQENRGLAAARNAAIRASRGAYLQLLDADDRLAPEKLATHKAFLDAHRDVDVVTGPHAYFRTEAPEVLLYSMHGHLKRPILPKVSGNADARRRLAHFNIMVACSPLFRREVFDRAGGFNEALVAVEDWDFWLRAAMAGCEFRFLPSEPLAFVRTSPGSMSRSPERMHRGLVEAARTFPHKPLPLVYQMALGTDDVLSGRRRQGFARIAHAARHASFPLPRLRWGVYALAALVLPRALFRRVILWPMPERAFELLRRLNGG